MDGFEVPKADLGQKSSKTLASSLPSMHFELLWYQQS